MEGLIFIDTVNFGNSHCGILRPPCIIRFQYEISLFSRNVNLDLGIGVVVFIPTSTLRRQLKVEKELDIQHSV